MCKGVDNIGVDKRLGSQTYIENEVEVEVEETRFAPRSFGPEHLML